MAEAKETYGLLPFNVRMADAMVLAVLTGVRGKVPEELERKAA